MVTRDAPAGIGFPETNPYVNTSRRGGRISSTSPADSIPPGCLMYTRPPGFASMVESAPHHDAQRAESVKNRKTVSGIAWIVTVRSM